MTDAIRFINKHWEIRIDGETSDTAGWSRHPDCKISDSAIRRRAKKQVADPKKYSVRWIVFGAVTKGGAPRKSKTVANKMRAEDRDAWEAQRNRVAITWSYPEERV